jgi:hemoglobin-like flavoprotein
MTSKQIELVQGTWEQVIPLSDQVAGLFYGRLFELNPELKPLFKSDIKEQGAKLMRMITVAVRHLGNLDQLVPTAEDLGRRHVTYGVQAEHYAVVGSALLWTLDQGLGDAFTQEVREAWTAAYDLLATVMKNAAAKSANHQATAHAER